GITGVFDPLSGTLTLSGSSSIANYQTALRSITYSATDPTPNGTRTVAFTVNDGGLNHNLSNTVSRSIAVTHVNHAPVATDVTQSVSEDAASLALDPAMVGGASDPDLDSPLSVSALLFSVPPGSVTFNPLGTSTFSPNGDFDSLAVGQSATKVIQ